MNTDEINRRRRDNSTFDKINFFVTIKDSETKKINNMLNDVIHSLTEAMKEKDDLFKMIFNKILYTGSFYKGTKVGKPEEFDLDLILKLPVRYDDIKIYNVEERPGFARIIINDNIKLPSWKKHEKTLNQWLNEDKCLNHEKLRGWFEGVVSKCFGDLHRGTNQMYLLPSRKNFSKMSCIKTCKSGPAFTLIVREDDTEFSVDLVPTLEFTKNPPNFITKYSTDNPCWHLIPKPSRVGNKADLDWRYCFSTYEKKILTEFGQYKPVIRQIKKLRDTQNWSSIIPSYYIETLFFHEFASESAKYRYPWSTNSYIEAFIYMLKQLKENCDTKRISYFWLTNHNLFDGTSWNQTFNISKRLDKIIKDVELEPSKLAEYVLTKEEFQQFKSKELSKKTQVYPPLINECSSSTSTPIENIINQTKNQPTCQIS